MIPGLTFGVIGHVDHGKTALVRALTGIETDRLEEERERGLSIVLGFAYLETGHGIVDLIDVPGHEAFVRAMIAGATALDGIVLCVAANESVMPQTIEHFTIAELLGLRRGVIVLTKTDLVDAETLDLAEAEIGDLVQGSFLDGAPILRVSVAEDQGLEQLRDALGELAAAPIARESNGQCFLPLDRVFTMKGFGVVGTGTLRGGILTAGDTVEIMPAGRSATVRGLQNHGRPVAQVWPGQRAAVNLRQIGRDEVRRGDVLTAPGSVIPSRRLDTEIALPARGNAPLKNGATLRLLTGTTEVMAKLRLLDKRELVPGERGLAQLRLDREVATRAAEPFLLRSYSPMRTIGGGRILEVNPVRHRRFEASVTARLATMASGDTEALVRLRLDAAGALGVGIDGLRRNLGKEAGALDDLLVDLGAIRVAEDRVCAADKFSRLLDEVVEVLERLHAEDPFRSGFDIGSLGSALVASAHADVMRHALRQLIEAGRVSKAGEVFRLAGHDPFARLSSQERALVARLERDFLARGIEPPPPEALVGTTESSQSVFRLLLEAGRLVRLRTYKNTTDLVLHADTLEKVRRVIELEFPYPRAFALKDVRDLLGSTRKYVVPLMEHLDATGATVRMGDMRRLRE